MVVFIANLAFQAQCVNRTGQLKHAMAFITSETCFAWKDFLGSTVHNCYYEQETGDLDFGHDYNWSELF